ncbi:MAG: sulfatase-like hydrolase/transferase [Sedimentisphaerales bacterium]
MKSTNNISRRHFMRRCVSRLAAIPAAGFAVCCAKQGPHKVGSQQQAGPVTKRPNIVFIIADDMGWADVGYHNRQIKTPHLDRLAREGVRLERHYVTPTCTPTRVGLMTGRYPSRFGVTSPAYGKIFDDDTVTLASALRDSGYDTAITGKWHMGSPPDWTPLRYGFNSSYGYFHGQIDPYTHLYKTGVRSWHRNDQYIDEKGHATDLITDEAIRVIRSKRNKPFFLYVAYSVPHYPLDEPDRWTSMYRDIEEPSRRWLAASITHMDYGIGRIVEALDRTGQRKNTLIIFVSDNGGQRSWHSKTQYKGRYANKPHPVLGNNQPLRGWKGQTYEGGIRVPALVNWLGMLKPRTKVDAPVHIVDWMPTLCKLVGYRGEKELIWDGQDIWPLICGQTEHLKQRTFYWKTPSESAVRQGRWKLIVSRKAKKVELYNLIDDPYEQQDLAQQHPQRVNDLRLLLQQIAKDDR